MESGLQSPKFIVSWQCSLLLLLCIAYSIDVSVNTNSKYVTAFAKAWSSDRMSGVVTKTVASECDKSCFLETQLKQPWKMWEISLDPPTLCIKNLSQMYSFVCGMRVVVHALFSGVIEILFSLFNWWNCARNKSDHLNLHEIQTNFSSLNQKILENILEVLATTEDFSLSVLVVIKLNLSYEFIETWVTQTWGISSNI